MLPQRRPAYISYTYSLDMARGTLCPLHLSPQSRPSSLGHGTSHRPRSSTLIPTSRVNHPLVRLAHESVDERRYQVVGMIFTGRVGRKYLQMEKEAVFGDVLCSLLIALLLC